MINYFKTASVLTAVLGLGACGGGGTGSPSFEIDGFGRIADAGPDAEIAINLENEENVTLYNHAVGSAAAVLGTEGGEWVAYGGFAPSPDVGGIIRSNVDFDATFKLLEFRESDLPSNYNGAIVKAEGPITLTANLNDQTVTGNNSAILVYGKINKTFMRGTVIYENMTLDMKGKVGATAIIGGFQGADATRVVSGALLGRAE